MSSDPRDDGDEGDRDDRDGRAQTHAEPERSDVRYVWGIQPVREAIAAHGGKLRRVLVEHRARDAEQLEAVARFARDRGATVERIDRSQLDRMARGERHQGVLAEAPPLQLVDEEELRETRAGDDAPLLIALDELTDPQNFGAIVRSAVALGASGVVFPQDRSAPLSQAMGRASAGAVEHARLCRVRNLARYLEASKETLQVVGLDAATPLHLHDVDLTGPTILVVGAEGKGLRRLVKGACTTLARLPMRGPIASLNASVAAALALYEAVRQRRSAASRTP